MIANLQATSMSFQAAEPLPPRVAYDVLLDNNRKIQEQENLRRNSLEHPAPATGQGQKLDVIA